VPHPRQGPGSATPEPGRDRPRAASPFAPAVPSIIAALLYAAALLAWLLLGDLLPGGRWFAVHLFTLGVLTNLVLTFSEHFGRTVTRTAGERSWWWPLLTNLGVLLVLGGIPTGQPWMLASGGTLLTGVVFAAYLRLRRMRRRAVGARFDWIARVYERAHGAFIHGAVLGVLLGTSVVAGGWYVGVRVAHLHANVLGWGGLTLLATLVFFGPTMVRTRIEPGADARAAKALRHGATGLSAAVLLLIASGAPGNAGTVARVGAAVGLAAFAWAATVVCLPVARAAMRAKPTAPRWQVVAVCCWFVLVVWADVGVVAGGAWSRLDALGVAALAGVLAQAMLATLTYLLPMLRGRTAGEREVVRARLEVGATVRALVFQLGVAALLVAGLRVADTLPLAGIGWTLVSLPVLATAAAGARRPSARRPPRQVPPESL
jgi:hypothetical protein